MAASFRSWSLVAEEGRIDWLFDLSTVRKAKKGRFRGQFNRPQHARARLVDKWDSENDRGGRRKPGAFEEFFKILPVRLEVIERGTRTRPLCKKEMFEFPFLVCCLC